MHRDRPVILLGLDAFDPDLALRWAGSRELPNLARLLGTGATAAVTNPFGLFVGALWASFATGLRPDRHGYHCWDEIDPATYRRRLVTPDLSGSVKFWDRIEAAGASVAVVDVPHARVEGRPDGIRIFEWGCHDRHFGLTAWPATLEETLEPHPVFGIDLHSARDFAADDFVHRIGPKRTAREEAALAEATTKPVVADLEPEGAKTIRVHGEIRNATTGQPVPAVDDVEGPAAVQHGQALPLPAGTGGR